MVDFWQTPGDNVAKVTFNDSRSAANPRLAVQRRHGMSPAAKLARLLLPELLKSAHAQTGSYRHQ